MVKERTYLDAFWAFCDSLLDDSTSTSCDSFLCLFTTAKGVPSQHTKQADVVSSLLTVVIMVVLLLSLLKYLHYEVTTVYNWVFVKKTKEKLPLDVLYQQICSKCAKYLSVGPVIIYKGEVICGRCPRPDQSVVSLYNLFARKYLFNCINHGAGCEELYPFVESWHSLSWHKRGHEVNCKFRSNEFYCPLCFFYNETCQVMYHFRQLHMNSVVQGYNFKQIQLYRELKNFVESVMSMDVTDLRTFISTAIKLFAVCNNCEVQFAEFSTVYVCPQYHLACQNCFLRTCKNCNEPCQWSSKSRLHNIRLTCEWKGCTEKRNVFQYISHKQMCAFRQYNCPDKICEYKGSLQGLREHWHLNPLRIKTSKMDNLSFYLLVPYGNEIMHIFLDINRTLWVADCDVVSPFSFHIHPFCDRVPIDEDWIYAAGKPNRYISLGHYDLKNITLLTNDNVYFTKSNALRRIQ